MRSSHPLLLEMAEELSKIGCDCMHTPESPSLGWLIANRGKIDIIHLHWPEHYYWPLERSRVGRLINRIADRSKLSDLLRLLCLTWLWAFVTLAKLLRLPIVWTIHDLYPHGGDRLEPYQLERTARSLLMRNVSAAIVNGASAAPLVTSEFGSPKHLVVAPLGNYRKFYPDTVAAAEARQAMGVGQNEIVFLCFGSMRKYRNALSVIHAFRNMREKDLRLFVVGGTYSDALRQEMEKAAWGDWRIRCFFQLVPNDQIEYLIKACDFVVMPGYRYLTSAVIVLALSFGRPVIAPR